MAARAIWSSSGKQASRQLSRHEWGAVSGWGLCNAGMPAVTGIQVCGRYPEKLFMPVMTVLWTNGQAWSASRVILW